MDCDRAVVSGCTIPRGMKEHQGPGLVIDGGELFLVANHITAYGDAVVIPKAAKAAVIQGNRINPHGHDGVVDESGELAKSAGNRRSAVTGNLVSE